MVAAVALTLLAPTFGTRWFGVLGGIVALFTTLPVARHYGARLGWLIAIFAALSLAGFLSALWQPLAIVALLIVAAAAAGPFFARWLGRRG